MSSERISDERLAELVDIYLRDMEHAKIWVGEESLEKDVHAALSELAALRRPLEQSAEVEAIRAEHIRCQQGGCFGERQEERQTLLSALDQAQREIQQLIANHENREDQMEAEIARLSRTA